MAINVALHHKTHYRYDRRINLGPQIVRLRPAPHCRTPILSYSLKVLPKNHFINWQQDPQGNYLARLVFPEPTTEFSVEVDLIAEMAVFNPFDFFLEPYAENCPFTYDDATARELRPFLETEPPGPLLSALLAKVDRNPIRTIDFLVDLNQRAATTKSATSSAWSPASKPANKPSPSRTGSCRDSAWLLVQILRHLGLAARFVSGYLIQLVARRETARRPRRPHHRLHRSARLDRSLSPRRRLGRPRSHLRPARRRRPHPARLHPRRLQRRAHLRPARSLQHRVQPRDVRPAHPRNAARHQALYRRQWNAIEALGHQVDADLTQRRRPPHHGRRAHLRLARRCRRPRVEHRRPRSPEAHAAPSNCSAACATVSLPAACCISARASGIPANLCRAGPSAATGAKTASPIWEDVNLIAEDEKAYRYTPDRSAPISRSPRPPPPGRRNPTPSPPTKTSSITCGRNASSPSTSIPSIPNSPIPSNAAASPASLNRASIEPVGFVLPLRRVPGRSGPRWTSQPWFLAASRMFLVPGDSPMGYRLPLDSLPWTKPEDVLYSYDTDPFATRDRLPARPARRPASVRQAPSTKSPIEPSIAKLPEKGESASWIARPALCVEPRDGKLFVFMPPVEYLTDYLDLVAAIEDTAAHLKMPVMIEGYTPAFRPAHRRPESHSRSRRHRSQHPARRLLGRAGRQHHRPSTTSPASRRLGTEKFMLDGQHTGTGGGNHVVIGGPTPDDSPFLRRPDLLRSLIGYWHNHPSLSYLFSGLFIGPTSQHPRVDEARTDSIYELEIAFNQIPDQRFRPHAPVARPTASSATCSPTSPATPIAPNSASTSSTRPTPPAPASAWSNCAPSKCRRTPHEPHPATAGARPDRPLLEEALPPQTPMVGHRAARPIHAAPLRPARLGGRHERFARRRLRVRIRMVRAPLRIPLPAHRHRHLQRHQLELRHALEPWHVLGEEASGGGTVRNVDSSLERLQVKVTGMIGSRYVVTLQRPPRPLHPTGATANSSPESATAPGSRPPACTPTSRSTRRWSSISWTPGPAAPSAAAPITSRTPVAAPTNSSRSTPRKPKAAASPASATPATPPAPCAYRPKNTTWNSR